MKVPNFRSNTQWGVSERKIRSREDTTLSAYREFFGHSIPADQQYWTMCGGHYLGKNGQERRAENDELTQLSRAGLFTRDQFHGVDIDAHTIETNRRFHPDVIWHHGDFLTTMMDAQCDGDFRPAVVNFDSTHEPRIGCAGLRNILRFLDGNVREPLLLLANFVMMKPYGGHHRHEATEVEHLLLAGDYPLADHWSLFPYYYPYQGGAAKHSKGEMGTFILVKREHEQVVVTPGRDVYAGLTSTLSRAS